MTLTKNRHLIKLSSLRLLFAQRFLKISLLKNFLLRTVTLLTLVKQRVAVGSSKLFFNKSSWNRRCLLTSRTYAVNSQTQLSRFVNRVFVSNGLLGGLRRHSW